MNRARIFFSHAIIKLAIVPFVTFAGCYFVLSFPLILSFSTAYFCDKGDGPQFIWNLWVVQRDPSLLLRLPWTTDLVHFPHGIPLLFHSLTPLNGLLSIPLSWIGLSPIVVFNTLVTFTFAMSGLSMFWLARFATRGAYLPSLAAGFAFAFCSHRCAHAFGHLHVLSTQWTPLYVLALLALASRPSFQRALAAAVLLTLIQLTDQYQFLTCALATPIILQASRVALRALITFITLATVCAPIVIATIVVGHREPLIGLHSPESFSADLVNPFVPDYTWHYHALTRLVWQPIGNYTETSVSIGPAVLVAAGLGMRNARKMWVILALTFLVLSFGPTLYAGTYPVFQWMPYRFLQMSIPSLKLGGNPARMMVMTQIAFCVLAAIGMSRTKSAWGWTIFILALVIGSQPRVFPTFSPEVDKWVHVLRDQPERGAVIDLISRGEATGLYAQTIHQRSIAMGEISRIPQSVDVATRAVLQRVGDRRFDELASMGFAFIVQPASSAKLNLPIVFEDRLARVYRLPQR